MSWKIALFQNRVELRLTADQLSITQEGQMTLLPLQDLCAIVLETPQITLTSALLSKLNAHNVALITCNEKHIPNGILLGFHQHSRQTEVTQLHINMGHPLKKQLWKRIIQQKVHNQAYAVHPYSKDHSKRINRLALTIKSGDKENIEAQAAKIYWQKIFYQGYRRHGGCIIDMGLNYAYSVIRAMIARCISAFGLIPSLGVHHCNQLNAFNLSDDLIEPFRPLIDAFVKERITDEHMLLSELSPLTRKELASIGFAPCEMNQKTYEIATAIDEMCQSFLRALREKDPKLLYLPSFANRNGAIDE
ncbi:MAG: type II CRISPR-associated endonuclease Cas1 [Alphaproteobacteria bacterium]|nr:type II CRISPR-associated endonuclease Cas1 [Alphaproteobacteria bacterium]